MNTNKTPYTKSLITVRETLYMLVNKLYLFNKNNIFSMIVYLLCYYKPQFGSDVNIFGKQCINIYTHCYHHILYNPPIIY